MFASYELDETPNREHKKLKNIYEDNELVLNEPYRQCLGMKLIRMAD